MCERVKIKRRKNARISILTTIFLRTDGEVFMSYDKELKEHVLNTQTLIVLCTLLS